MIKLDFRVCPKFLKDNTFIKDPVKVIIVDPQAIFLTGIMGESGRKMVSAGAPFYFTKRLANKLITKGIAKEIK